MTIYVVEGTTGEYSDRVHWHVAAFLDEEAAKARVVRCSARARLAMIELNDEHVWEKERAIIAKYSDADPHMRDPQYNGVRYSYYPVTLVAEDT